jgi:hypothetical protein
MKSTMHLSVYGNWKFPPAPVPSAPFCGLIATQSKESVIAIRPDHT